MVKGIGKNPNFGPNEKMGKLKVGEQTSHGPEFGPSAGKSNPKRPFK